MPARKPVLALRSAAYFIETRVRGAQGCQAQTDAIRKRAPRAKDFANRRYRHNGKFNDVVAFRKTRCRSTRIHRALRVGEEREIKAVRRRDHWFGQRKHAYSCAADQRHDRSTNPRQRS
jgi:hypothetical protein